jgi:GTPase
MGTAQAVAILQNNFRNAIRACKTLTLSVPGAGKSTVDVREVSAPQAGTNPVAARFTVTTGPNAGAEINMVTTGVGDVVAALTVVGTADDVDGATQAAVDKATSTLKTGKTGA